jgi:hypothetical protein
MADPVPAKEPVFKGYRTFLFNGAVATGLALVAYLQAHGTEVIPQAYWPFVAMSIPMINTWLRSQTSTPPLVK